MATSVRMLGNTIRPALCLTTRNTLTYLLPRTFASKFHTYNQGGPGDRNQSASSNERRNQKPHTRPDFYRDLGKDSDVKQPSMTIRAGKMGPDSGDSKRGPGIDYGSRKGQDDALLHKRRNENLGGGSNNTSANANNTNSGKSNISGSTSGSSVSGANERPKKADMDQTSSQKKEHSKNDHSSPTMQSSMGSSNQRVGVSQQSSTQQKHDHAPMENDSKGRPPSDMSDTVHRDPSRESAAKVAFAADASSKKAAEDKSAVIGDTRIDPTDTSFVQANPGNRAGAPMSSNDNDYARSLKSGVKDNSYKVGMGNSGEANIKKHPDGVSRPDKSVVRDMAKKSENSGLEPGRSTGVGSNENITTKDVYTGKDHDK